MPTNAPLSAILHLPHRASAAGQPLISEDILFRPLLSHVTAALKDAGVTRVLLASDDDLSISDHFFSEVFSVDLVSFGESAAAFLGERPAPLLFLSGALYFLPEAVSALRNAPRSRLMAADTPLPLFYLEAPTADALLALSEGDASGFSEVDGWDDTFDRCAPVESLLDVAMLNDALRDRVNLRLMENGVRFLSPDTSYISADAHIGRGTTIYPNTIVRGDTVVGANCVLGPNTIIENAKIGDECVVNSSQVYDSVVGNSVRIGPFAYIRPDCVLGDHIKIGDFVELKKSKIGNGTKVSHLTYIGDAVVGENVNFGCGTVTVNYDGAAKHITTVDDGAFIGCNTNLVAPVRVGKYAYTAAGTTITEEVPDYSLAIGRTRQINKSDWVRKSQKKKE